MSNYSPSNIYIKYHGLTVLDDWKRVELLARVCEPYGNCTAKPLWVDPGKQTIGYEKLEDITPLLHPRFDWDHMMHRVGKLIGYLHAAHLQLDDLEAADKAEYPMHQFGLPERDERALRRSLPVGWFHTDCWHGNFFIRGEDERILVIDPIPDGYTVQRGFFFANGAVDIAVMHMSIFLCRPLQAELHTNWPRALTAAQALLDGYLETVGAKDAGVRSALLSLSRRVAINHVNSYKSRLAVPIAQIKRAVGQAIIRRLDRELHWNNP